MKRFLIVAVAPLILTACTDEAGARRALEAHGLTPLEVGGLPSWGCSNGEFYMTKFKARNARGHEVTGVVCSGPLKGSAIRTF